MDDSLKEFSYPVTWDPNNKTLLPYISEDKNWLFIKSKVKSSGKYQAVIFNLLTGEPKMIESDNILLDIVTDFKEWKEHPDLFLLSTAYTLYAYNIENGEVELLFDELDRTSSTIYQSENGRYSYIFGKESSDFYVLDLDEKTSEHHVLPR